MSVLNFPSSSKDTSRAHLNPGGLHLNLMTSAKTLFEIRSDSQVLGVKISTYVLGRDDSTQNRYHRFPNSMSLKVEYVEIITVFLVPIWNVGLLSISVSQITSNLSAVKQHPFHYISGFCGQNLGRVWLGSSPCDIRGAPQLVSLLEGQRWLHSRQKAVGSGPFHMFSWAE